jgi:hypothetical protein
MKVTITLEVVIKNDLIGHPVTFLTLLKQWITTLQRDHKGVYQVGIRTPFDDT